MNKETNSSLYLKDDEVKAYASLCDVIKSMYVLGPSSAHYVIEKEKINNLPPLVTLIKRLSTMLKFTLEDLYILGNVDYDNEYSLVKHYVEKAETLMNREEAWCSPEFWRMVENYDVKNKFNK